jgi:hypothetical protein
MVDSFLVLETRGDIQEIKKEKNIKDSPRLDQIPSTIHGHINYIHHCFGDPR